MQSTKKLTTPLKTLCMLLSIALFSTAAHAAPAKKVTKVASAKVAKVTKASSKKATSSKKTSVAKASHTSSKRSTLKVTIRHSKKGSAVAKNAIKRTAQKEVASNNDSFAEPVSTLHETTPTQLRLNNSVASQFSASGKEWRPNLADPIGQLVSDLNAERARDQHSSQLSSDVEIASSSDEGSHLAQAALEYLGVRYRFGGTSPATGFDCSGLIQYAAKKHLGINLPRTAASLAHEGTSVSRDDLQPGDLVFFNTRGGRNSHVGVYLGNNEFVHAPRTGSSVRIEKISAYWDKHYNGARRLDGTTNNQITHF